MQTFNIPKSRGAFSDFLDKAGNDFFDLPKKFYVRGAYADSLSVPPPHVLLELIDYEKLRSRVVSENDFLRKYDSLETSAQQLRVLCQGDHIENIVFQLTYLLAKETYTEALGDGISQLRKAINAIEPFEDMLREQKKTTATTLQVMQAVRNENPKPEFNKDDKKQIAWAWNLLKAREPKMASEPNAKEDLIQRLKTARAIEPDEATIIGELAEQMRVYDDMLVKVENTKAFYNSIARRADEFYQERVAEDRQRKTQKSR